MKTAAHPFWLLLILIATSLLVTACKKTDSVQASPAAAANAPLPTFSLTSWIALAVTSTSLPTSTAAPTATSLPPVALTPPMGFSSWARYMCGDGFNESTFTNTADALVSNGLAAKGYVYLNVDDCWMGSSRDSSGNLVADPARFPHGMNGLGDYLHERGLKIGIYEDGGLKTCEGYPGSYGHFQQDANLFASWGADYIKLDTCNFPSTPPGMTSESFARQIYADMSAAIAKSGRPMLFSEAAPMLFINKPDYNTVLGWVGQFGNSWRVAKDIPNHGDTGKWAGVVNNYEADITLSAFARPGGWNDPDFLITGDNDVRLTTAEQQSQMALWSIMAAPLIMSTNVTDLTPKAMAILGNSDVIAVDQDSLGIQGTRVQTSGGVDVIVKKLDNGDIAVALFNKGNSSIHNGSVSAQKVGFGGPGCYAVKDLWAGTTKKTTDIITARLGVHATALFRVSVSAGCSDSTPAGS